MRTRVDSRFRAEAARFELRYTCESCAHFDPDTERCASGYPNHEHRSRSFSSEATEAVVVFCKEYELV